MLPVVQFAAQHAASCLFSVPRNPKPVLRVRLRELGSWPGMARKLVQRPLGLYHRLSKIMTNSVKACQERGEVCDEIALNLTAGRMLRPFRSLLYVLGISRLSALQAGQRPQRIDQLDEMKFLSAEAQAARQPGSPPSRHFKLQEFWQANISCLNYTNHSFSNAQGRQHFTQK